jgi:predicted nucleic acid-binding protein/GNAT superfamily N-acetyltransferase
MGTARQGNAKTFEILTISDDESLLEQVIELGDAQTASVGFFQRAAFVRAWQERKIIVALDSTAGTILGYVLYWTSRRYAVLQQLVVAPQSRGQGIARGLVEALKEATQPYPGIQLHCARDLEANMLWPKLGFVPLGEKYGRGAKERILTRYWFDHCHPTLFDEHEQEKLGTTKIVVLDANVFFDFVDETSPRHAEVLPLLADWLASEITISITPELFSEIDRAESKQRRELARLQATRFHQIRCDPAKTRRAAAILRPLMHRGEKPSDKSDLSHLAFASAGSASFFLTYDSQVLTNAKRIQEGCGLQVCRPSELITELHECQSVLSYRPSRLAGASPVVRRTGASDINTVIAAFANSSNGESRRAFRRRFDRLLAEPDSLISNLVSSSNWHCPATPPSGIPL